MHRLNRDIDEVACRNFVISTSRHRHLTTSQLSILILIVSSILLVNLSSNQISQAMNVAQSAFKSTIVRRFFSLKSKKFVALCLQFNHHLKLTRFCEMTSWSWSSLSLQCFVLLTKHLLLSTIIMICSRSSDSLKMLTILIRIMRSRSILINLLWNSKDTTSIEMSTSLSIISKIWTRSRLTLKSRSL